MQYMWPMMSEGYELKHVDEHLLKQCKDYDAAIELCIQESQIKYTQAHLADLLQIQSAQLSKFLNRKELKRNHKKTANFPTNKIPLLMEICGNYAPLQYQILVLGFRQDMLKELEKLAA